MQLPALALILAAVFVWAVMSGRARVISAPIFFVAIGLLLAEGVKLLHLAPDPHLVKLLAEVTLVWVLFADASRVQICTLRQDAGALSAAAGHRAAAHRRTGHVAGDRPARTSVPGTRCCWAPRSLRPTRRSGPP